ncbi:YkgJ family cysteine cluster protein [Pendulispora rubella]|uniref:YkgJ family cysteine cluster protein n=1 Tax=Pendulispora rubella TaxID=2741070 RepID=A0ABZ2LGD9_9BACT
MPTPVTGEPDPNGADCVGCGRCCHHPAHTVHFLESDDVRMGKRLLEIYTEEYRSPPGFRFMKNVPANNGIAGETRCAGLDVSVPEQYPCAVYEVRPEDCRIVEPGSPACLEARRLGHLGNSVEFHRAPS